MADSKGLRRSLSAPDCKAVATALENGITAAMIKNCNSGNMVSYKSLDFKRTVDHVGISAHEAILHNLLTINPTGIFTQKLIHTALADVLVGMSLESDAEVDAYKIRVMLSHIRLISQRNLPPHLPEHVAASCSRLVALLSMEKGTAGPEAPTQNTNPNHCII
jgi:hypothetical protein